jgi:plastocyanin
MSMKTKVQEDFVTSIEATQNTQKKRPARRKPSIAERTAFWASLATTLQLAGITALVRTLSGTLSEQLIILIIGGVFSTLLIATRNRWTTLVATLLNGYLFYLIWTEPFVTESLGNPKGPDGGFGHFQGDVLVICTAILTLICCLGATIQYFRGGSQKTPRWYPVVVGLMIGMALGATYIGGISQPSSASSGLTTTNGVLTLHVQATGFLQQSVTLSKGSRLLLVSDTSEKHELFNGTWQNGQPVVAQEPGAPLVSDVILQGNSVTIGPFITAGTYHIFCTLHKGMELTIIVQ